MSVTPGHPEEPLTAAQQKLVVANLQWAKDNVRRLGMRYGAVLQSKDVEQLAGEGLSRAARGYDRSFGVPFTIYALKFVRGAVKRAGNRERRFHDSLFDAGEGWTEEGDLFQETDETARDNLHHRAKDLADAMIGGGLGMATRFLAVGGEDSVFRAMTLQRVRDALGSVPGRPREVLERRIFDGQLVDDVAKEMSLSSATVRRDYQEGLKKVARRLAGVVED